MDEEGEVVGGDVRGGLSEDVGEEAAVHVVAV